MESTLIHDPHQVVFLILLTSRGLAPKLEEPWKSMGVLKGSEQEAARFRKRRGTRLQRTHRGSSSWMTS
jgi:hypothetical protein